MHRRAAWQLLLLGTLAVLLVGGVAVVSYVSFGRPTAHAVRAAAAPDADSVLRDDAGYMNVPAGAVLIDAQTLCDSGELLATRKLRSVSDGRSLRTRYEQHLLLSGWRHAGNDSFTRTVSGRTLHVWVTGPDPLGSIEIAASADTAPLLQRC